jgi:hypothetical protein
MTDNVFFPERFAQGPARDGDEQHLELLQRDAADRNQRAIVRLREIESAAGGSQGRGKKGHVFRRTSDRIAAAREVGALVRQARERNITVEGIRSALPGTTRLDRYMLRPDLDPSDADKKSGKLQQRVSGYLEAAEVIARLTRQDPDALKIRVLSGTSLWSQPSAALTEDDPRASHLAAELGEMGRSVVRRTKLEKLFERARRVPGVWDVALETFDASMMACLHQDSYLELFQHWTEAPPLPSVPLVRCVHAVFPTAVLLESVGRAEILSGDAAHDDEFDSSVRGAWFQLSREIRLALGPTTSPDNVGPMFESRAHIAIGFAEPSPHICKLVPSYTLKPIDTVWAGLPLATFQTYEDGLWRRVAMTESLTETDAKLFGDGGELIAWPPNPSDPQSLPVEHYYHSWFALNAHSVAFWLDRTAGSNNTEVVTPPEGPRDAQPGWYTMKSTARQIERALASGGLEEALEKAVRRLEEMLDRREAQWRSQAAAEHTERMALWQREP